MTNAHDAIMPFDNNSVGNYGEPVTQREIFGLTKRELFAAMAMQGITAGAVTRGCPSNEWTDLAMAVKVADALIEELNKEQI